MVKNKNIKLIIKDIDNVDIDNVDIDNVNIDNINIDNVNIDNVNIDNVEDLVTKLSNNFTEIISIDKIKKYDKLYWGGNGVGDRWANKKFNYTVIYSNKKPKMYSENDNDEIPKEKLELFLENNKGNGIIGIYVHSKRTNTKKRTISKEIHKQIICKSCVICGTHNDIICDHKNDLYNDEQVLHTKTQKITDFQPLCNHCNLQKRQICKEENEKQRIYSAKNIERYKKYNFEFPWEKKVFDKTDVSCKNDTYWFDPVEFENKIYCYISYIIPVITEIKNKVKNNKLQRQ
jgi:5-methylcytosine-specific restriction endonuclease McrA